MSVILSKEIKSSIDALRKQLVDVDDETRREVIEQLLDGFCPQCMTETLPCYCASCFDD